MLDRIRFTTSDPAALSRELDRFQLAVQEEIRTLEKKTMRRLVRAETVSGVTGQTVRVVAAFDSIQPVNPANGDVDVLLPAATRDDASRLIILERLTGAGTVTLHGGTRLINNDATPVTLTSFPGALIIEWDGLGFWTVP